MPFLIKEKESSHHFQSLWELGNWSVYGYEALYRPEGNMNPEIFFQNAREMNTLYEFDTFSILKAVEGFTLIGEIQLFINIYPSTLLHENFPAFINSIMAEYPMAKGKLVFELNESNVEEHIWNMSELKSRILWLRSIKLLVALDDFGKGTASLQKIIEFAPDYIKLDRFFSNGLSENKKKQHMISLIVQYCSKFGSNVILEGIEKPVDLAMARFLKVKFGQGYLLGIPSELDRAIKK
jgi:EAL domain-containing protein (putative c-di-GMP-specific phosphodiesterase class I)